MGPIISTTYSIAMGHRPETLAESGGLRPADAGRAREPMAQVVVSRVWSWLETMLIRVRLQHLGIDVRAGDTGSTSPPYPLVAATPQGSAFRTRL
jgi:hypothetical protein